VDVVGRLNALLQTYVLRERLIVDLLGGPSRFNRNQFLVLLPALCDPRGI